MSTEYTVTLYRSPEYGDEIEITVKGDYTPGTEDVPYLRNGDPGYPGNPPEIEITSATRDYDGEEVELTEEETERALELIQEAADQD